MGRTIADHLAQGLAAANRKPARRVDASGERLVLVEHDSVSADSCPRVIGAES
ncbi:hypothetical protein ABH944_004353 [Caballeronia udeis]|uniref:LacI family transcriptional regulator n=1 Tax=Caballeronia udeis TaxID=1232866 RepID=A0ABW8MJH1_9BURK